MELIDLRKHNSWVASFDQISCVEVVEVNCVNSLSPQILISRFVGKMSLDSSCDHYIINVSAMEGKFSRKFKSGRHAHTNAAKSSLNMITRTLGATLASQRIYINSVDTGWITDEKPFQDTVSAALKGFSTPIDECDAMSRIVDPIFVGINSGVNNFGKFFKDYKVSSW
ncbi:MAG: putative short-chain dehydrogenase [Streblomastix strix]|uniref:Putative short-chain dehydrogenase n=1 Tax=Streblomastix strix TaxID=222440 RepID=A0A5J4VBE0_9EUKA|nr:MAG: putative short-chain dehydrogenase [Streblomastix strix]